MKKLTMAQYQKWTKKRWRGNPSVKLDLRDDYIMTAGLGGETGEVLEILKKRVRDNKLDMAHLIEELGDVFFYWNMICNRFKLDTSVVMNANVTKLNNRTLKMKAKRKAKK